MKIHPVGKESLHADGRTDGQRDRHGEPNSRFPQFCDRGPKMQATNNVEYRSLGSNGAFSIHKQPMEKSEDVSVLARTQTSSHEGVWRNGGMRKAILTSAYDEVQ